MEKEVLRSSWKQEVLYILQQEGTGILLSSFSSLIITVVVVVVTF